MSEETQGTSQEDRFLGVRTTIEPPEPAAEANTAEDLQIEVVDDRPQEDQRAAPQQKSDDDGVANDEELKEVGQRGSTMRSAELKKRQNDCQTKRLATLRASKQKTNAY